MHFFLDFPSWIFKNPFKVLNKKLESGQNFLNILMHFFQIFLHKIFKDPLKVLNKKLKFGQKFSPWLLPINPFKVANKKFGSPKKPKKSYTEIWIILRLTKAWNLWFPFNINMGGQQNFRVPAILAGPTLSILNLICGFAFYWTSLPGGLSICPGSAWSLSSSQKSEKTQNLFPKSCIKPPKTM